MKSTLLAAACLITVMQASAENAPEPDLTTCWYDQRGEFTGASPANSGAKAGTTVQTGTGGDHAWSHTIPGSEASLCPARLPVSSAVSP